MNKKKLFMILFFNLLILFSGCKNNIYLNNNLSNNSDLKISNIDSSDLILDKMSNNSKKTNINKSKLIKNEILNIKNKSQIIDNYKLKEMKKKINKSINKGSKNNLNEKFNFYQWHKNITTTKFWIGEGDTLENDYISNLPSAWDEKWVKHYGGIDLPDIKRNNQFFPIEFEVKENPYYFALPLNDLDENGKRKNYLLKKMDFLKNKTFGEDESFLKNQWIKIKNIKTGKIAYAQWEDVGPFGENDEDYVIYGKKPKNKKNNNAGLDLSPALTLYLGLNGMEKVDWKFVNFENVENGPWKKVITRSGFCYNNCNYKKSLFLSSNSSWYKPKLNDRWFWQLSNSKNVNTNLNVSIYDLDLFKTNQSIINELHKNNKKVMCYFSAGSWENYREDANKFNKSILGNTLEEWEDEKWLDISDYKIFSKIMEKRFDLAKNKNCDGVEVDNIDAYNNDNGFNLNYQDQLKYNIWLTNQAHKRGLFIALKNDLDQVNDLVNYFDLEVNEQCFQYNECDKLLPFIKHNKPVFGVEYELNKNQFCEKSKKMKFNFFKSNYDLNGNVEFCN